MSPPNCHHFFGLLFVMAMGLTASFGSGQPDEFANLDLDAVDNMPLNQRIQLARAFVDSKSAQGSSRQARSPKGLFFCVLFFKNMRIKNYLKFNMGNTRKLTTFYWLY